MTHLLPPFKRASDATTQLENFADGITAASHLGAPDSDKAMRQYENYTQALRDCGLEVRVLPADERFPDGHFVEDPFVIFRNLAFHCRSGAPARQGEGESLKPHLSGFRIVEPPSAAKIDGGDVLFCADRVLVGNIKRARISPLVTQRCGPPCDLCRPISAWKPCPSAASCT